MRKKRLADWLEKMSAAFLVGAVITDKGFWIPICIGIACLGISLYLTDRS